MFVCFDWLKMLQSFEKECLATPSHSLTYSEGIESKFGSRANFDSATFKGKALCLNCLRLELYIDISEID